MYLSYLLVMPGQVEHKSIVDNTDVVLTVCVTLC
jgi:hypothetical protein